MVSGKGWPAVLVVSHSLAVGRGQSPPMYMNTHGFVTEKTLISVFLIIYKKRSILETPFMTWA